MKHHGTGYLSHGEKLLWGGSTAIILLAFLLFDRENYLTLTASLIGAAALIFCAKGNPTGQLLMLIFSVLYGIIALSFAYFGEMITYWGMTAPMALLALISWLRHPAADGQREVRVGHLRRGEWWGMCILNAGVTLGLYWILRRLHTANLGWSTVSVTTSFAAACLSFRRSEYFALAYAANDAVLILLWCIAAQTDRAYVSVVICFCLFLINDLYGFFNWRKMRRRQLGATAK